MNYSNSIYNYFKHNREQLHIGFWCALFVLELSRALMKEHYSIVQTFVYDLCMLLPQMLMAYYLAYFVIPKFFLKKRFYVSILLFILGTYLLGIFARILIVHVGETLVRVPPFKQETIIEILMDWKKLLFHYIPAIYSVSLIFLFIKYFVDYNRIREKDLTLDKEKAEGELKTLKAQLNPHFLFNTLNNIYTLSLVNSPKTPVSIGKLSEILDHILYKCNGKFVLLSSEIKLLEDYIDLEKLRYDDRLQVSFKTNIETDAEIPPLILLSLVENAFKHGAGEDSGSPKIDISITNKNSLFTFEISNTISNHYEESNKEAIGLANIKKQLDLIYQNQYSLNIDSSKNIFTVTLQINQNSI